MTLQHVYMVQKDYSRPSNMNLPTMNCRMPFAGLGLYEKLSIFVTRYDPTKFQQKTGEISVWHLKVSRKLLQPLGEIPLRWWREWGETGWGNLGFLKPWDEFGSRNVNSLFILGGISTITRTLNQDWGSNIYILCTLEYALIVYSSSKDT